MEGWISPQGSFDGVGCVDKVVGYICTLGS
jgi:hypothetical protein